MSFQSLINLRNCRVTRNTDVILESIQITDPLIGFRQPVEVVYLSIVISGWSGGIGVVIVSGVVAGGSETFNFTQNGPRIGTKAFESISGITAVGFAPTTGNIIIRAITSANLPIKQEIEIFTAMNCWVDLRRGGVQIILPGGVVQSVSKLFCLHDELNPLAENDLIYYNNIRYRIDFIEFVYSRSETPHHLELILERLKAN
ncbi:unnamed protein product [marine sediment metagenome]|uniref:Uncharacterized protein n=1 Tax=marine sediment metagenome TaxID=412755 RepID=X1AUQ1_9ZZZZ